MSQYDEEVLKQINQSVDLVSYIGSQMDLYPKSGEYYAHCPKHIDITPSFSVSPEKNFYYCFSCGATGGIINYLKDFEGLSFEESVEKAARLANIDTNSMCNSDTIQFLRNWKRISEPKKHVKHEILQPSVLDKYIKAPIQEWIDEGIPQCVMDIFEIRIDEWGNRIVYPVYDIDGNLINIKGRTRYKNYKQLRLPKYINYYKVGVMDYFQGLNITLQDVKIHKEIIIFESVKSVMKAYSWGYPNCASAEKHSLTEEQIQLLISLKVNIVLAYDSDVDYRGNEVSKNIKKLKRITNLYIIDDKEELLGGQSAKNAPVDCGKEIWERLYRNKRKIV